MEDHVSRVNKLLTRISRDFTGKVIVTGLVFLGGTTGAVVAYLDARELGFGWPANASRGVFIAVLGLVGVIHSVIQRRRHAAVQRSWAIIVDALPKQTGVPAEPQKK
jgi:hypothetical protein